MGKLVVIEQQSMLDVAIQQYGSVEGMVNLINDNTDLGLTLNSNLTPGLKLNITNDAVDVDIVNYFKRKQLLIATKGTQVAGDFDANDFDENEFNT